MIPLGIVASGYNVAAPPSGFSKFRTFNGSTDDIEWTLGNLVSANSVPQTFVVVVRLLTDGADAELIATPGFDPLDIFFILGGKTIAFADGGSFVNGPTWNIVDGWVLFAFRSVSGSSAKWSKSVYSGSSWPTPTHTTPGVTVSNRTYPSSGVITMGNAATVSFDCVLMARWNTDLTDAAINNMVNGVAAVQATSGITNLWHVGKTTPSDLVGTSGLSALNGTTLSSGDSPFPS